MYFVRYGSMGLVGRFRPVDATVQPRGARVVCRSPRGLEVGEVLGPLDRDAGAGDCDGELLRRMTREDDLLWTRVRQRGGEAFAACASLLAERRLDVSLVDVEPLFDGQSLCFYFLGDAAAPALSAVVAELAETFDAHVQLRRFADTLAGGCGPDCGTAAGGGCGESCGSCSLAAACKPAGPAS